MDPGSASGRCCSAIIGTATALPASGVFGSNERTLWFWSTITAGMGSGIIAISFGWIFTLVRNADPNYVSGVGAFMALSGGFYLLASTMPILKEFRRSKEYDGRSSRGRPGRCTGARARSPNGLTHWII